jgi:hypothetical protein
MHDAFRTPESGAVSYLNTSRDRELLLHPRPGRLTVFPAHVRHRVLPYYGVTERIIIGLNLTFAARDS